MKEYKISNGIVRVTSSEIYFKYHFYKYFLDFIKFFGSIGLIIKFYYKVIAYDTLEGFYEKFKVVIFGLASIAIMYFFLEIILKKFGKIIQRSKI